MVTGSLWWVPRSPDVRVARTIAPNASWLRWAVVRVSVLIASWGGAPATAAVSSAGLLVDEAGQPGEKPADHLHVLAADRSGLLPGGGGGQPGRQGLAGR